MEMVFEDHNDEQLGMALDKTVTAGVELNDKGSGDSSNINSKTESGVSTWAGAVNNNSVDNCGTCDNFTLVVITC